MKLIFTILIFLCTLSLHAQDSTSSYYLSIITNIPDATVYIESINAGKTPLSNYKLSKGIHNIQIINPSNLTRPSWENENIVLNNFEIISDTTVIKNFRNLYFINSDPFNAGVFKNDSLLGYTPYRFFAEGMLSWNLDLKKNGYKTKTLDLSGFTTNPVNVNVKLIPELNYPGENIIYKDKNTNFIKKRNVPFLTALGLATLGGAFATINLKNKANNYYDNYLENLNQADLNSSNRYDTYSLISLIATQVVLGTLIYFLFFD